MDAGELEARIAEFPSWHYSFEFDNGVRTSADAVAASNRHEQRRRYFFASLLGLTGGTLQGRRVLDLGCNAGFWSLAALDAGAEFVLGVDAQQMYIDQAELVFEQKQIDPARFRFERGNVFKHDIAENFDVVLCLGLLDHVARPLELFELMARTGAALLVIETTISRSRLSVFEASSMYQKKDLVEGPLALIPSRQAVVDVAAEFGYEAVPLAVNITDYTGLEDYRRERRLAFICARGVDMEGLSVQPSGPMIPWWLRDPRALIEAYV